MTPDSIWAGELLQVFVHAIDLVQADSLDCHFELLVRGPSGEGRIGPWLLRLCRLTVRAGSMPPSRCLALRLSNRIGPECLRLVVLIVGCGCLLVGLDGWRVC